MEAVSMETEPCVYTVVPVLVFTFFVRIYGRIRMEIFDIFLETISEL